MGQTEHRAYVALKNAEEKAKRNPYFSDLKEEVKDAQIKHLEAQLQEKREEEISRSIWGF